MPVDVPHSSRALYAALDVGYAGHTRAWGLRYVLPALRGVALPEQDTQTQTDALPVVDEEIQAIIDAGEAGIGDLIVAYEPIERLYFDAVQVNVPTATYSTDTNPA